MSAYSFFVSGPKFTNFFFQYGMKLVDQVFFRISLCWSILEIFVVKNRTKFWIFLPSQTWLGAGGVAPIGRSGHLSTRVDDSGLDNGTGRWPMACHSCGALVRNLLKMKCMYFVVTRQNTADLSTGTYHFELSEFGTCNWMITQFRHCCT